MNFSKEASYLKEIIEKDANIKASIWNKDNIWRVYVSVVGVGPAYDGDAGYFFFEAGYDEAEWVANRNARRKTKTSALGSFNSVHLKDELEGKIFIP